MYLGEEWSFYFAATLVEDMFYGIRMCNLESTPHIRVIMILWLSFQKQEYELGAFELHQACERYYHAICLVFTNYRPKSHKLAELSAMTKEFSRDLASTFTLGTDFEKRGYDLLCRAYIEARYNRHFTVTKEELAYMIERTEVLKEVTQHICSEKIASYDKLIAEGSAEGSADLLL